MRYYYRKIKTGENKGKYMKVTVNDTTLGTKEEPFEIVDACIVDKINEQNGKLIYQKNKSAG